MTNPAVKLEDTFIGEENMGVLIHEFQEGATMSHLRCENSLRAWPVERLFVEDGKSLLYHHLQQPQLTKVIDGRKRPYVNIKRKRKDRDSMRQSKKDKLLLMENVALINTKDCCRQKCCQYFDRELAMTIRKKHWVKSFQDRKDEKIQAILNALHLVGGERVLGLEGTTICLEAWRLIHGYGKSQFAEQKKFVMAGVRISSHGPEIKAKDVCQRRCHKHMRQ